MQPRSRTRLAALLVGLTLVVGACGDSATTTTAETPSTVPPFTEPDYGDVSELLNAFPLEGIDVTTDRKRFSPDVEQVFINEARGSVIIDEVGVDLDSLTDGTIVYLGYLYCGALDQGDTVETALGNVAASLAALNAAAAPTDDDWWRATIIAFAITAAPCGEYFEATEAYVNSL